jgi:hypothetical protein
MRMRSASKSASRWRQRKTPAHLPFILPFKDHTHTLSW